MEGAVNKIRGVYAAQVVISDESVEESTSSPHLYGAEAGGARHREYVARQTSVSASIIAASAWCKCRKSACSRPKAVPAWLLYAASRPGQAC